ncbi:acetate kinase [Christensenellaceae bacterium OttesenSCG-928-M15]|nr:acetate kinase [Christensenellaceae bacterium OttesenSCG-928-M15]
MIIMVINSGSSSLKYQVFKTEKGEVLAKGLCERIGIDGVFTHDVPGREKLTRSIPMQTHQRAIETVIEYLTSEEHGVLKDLRDISAVGHRIGHGGEYFSDSTLVDENVKEGIRKCIPLAPLHNPAGIMGIEACEAVLGKEIPQVVVCDTAFHQTIPRKAFTYSLPYEICEKHHIRRYGFHGTSHKFVAEQAAEFLNMPFTDMNIVTCHLGNGSSLAAIEKGKSIDTTMGFTALEGVVMGTRVGDTDPAMVPFLMEAEGLTGKEVESIFYKQSGLLGLSGVSSDLRDIEEAAKNGNEYAQNAIDVLCYQIKKYIGAYTFAMGGVDAVVFTAGIGENSSLIREGAISGLEGVGICLDREKNAATRGKTAMISTDASPVKVLVMPTNEEWVIASDTEALVLGR